MKNRSAENFIVLIASLVCMFIFGGLAFMYNVWLGAVEVLLSVLFVIAVVIMVKDKHGNLTNYIEDITFHVDNATKESLVYAPMPVIIIKENGKILWYNKFFNQICGDNELYDTDINEIIADVDVQKLFSDNELKTESDLFDKHYCLLANTLKTEKKDYDSSLAVLYLLDIDSYYKIKQKYEDDMPIVAIISIDNYDDVLHNTPEAYRSLLMVEIENRIYNWLSFSESIIKKIERDKYMVLIKKKHLNTLIEDKFSILDKVKEIKCGNKFSPTLSIGIGVKEGTLHSADDYATSAMTLALGRGGDQVVIKSFGNVAYYGGKSREHEKTTKVKARVTALAIKELFEHSSNIVVMGHKFPDTDSIGAAIGVGAFARSFGKMANIVYDGSSPQINNILNSIKENIDYEGVIIGKQDAQNYVKQDTLIVVVDTHRPSYTDVPEILNGRKNIILIDHHRRASEFIENTSLVYHEPYASSTCEMVAELLQYVGDELNLSTYEAEALYAGMVMDTKQFTTKTGVRTFEAAAFLKRFGVDVNRVRSYFKNDFGNFVEISKIASSAEIYNKNIAISVYRNEGENFDRTVPPQAADALLTVNGIEASFVISEMDSVVAVNGRSTGNVNVQVILEKLGGGGHHNIAGVQIPNTTCEDVVQKLKSAIDEYREEQIK